MTTWIGSVGAMTPVGCVETMPSTHEARVVHGGGAGTLSPSRVRVYGPGARSWEVGAGSRSLAEHNAVTSLARRQSIYGGSYRVIPCDAADHNMMTPQASEELSGWTNLAVGPVSSFPVVTDYGGAFPVMMGRVDPGQGWAISPGVPVTREARVFYGLYVAGVGRWRMRVPLADGQLAFLTRSFSQPADALTRVTDSRPLPENYASLEIAVEATEDHPVHFAWPSIAYADNPYVTGRGCDRAYLSMPSRAPVATWGQGIESATYTIQEVGV